MRHANTSTRYFGSKSQECNTSYPYNAISVYIIAPWKPAPCIQYTLPWQSISYNFTKSPLEASPKHAGHTLTALFRHTCLILSAHINHRAPFVLRQKDCSKLFKKHTHLKTFGERSFGYIAPTVWNSLPADLRASPSLPTFKVNLNTHFFRQAF